MKTSFESMVNRNLRKQRNSVGRRKWPTAVDLFSGCGSVTAALKKRNFRVVAAVDNDPVACSTFKKNHPTTSLLEEDIRKLDPRTLLRFFGEKESLDLLVVCAPCQPFSNQNRKKHSNDKRKNLILESVRFAKVLQPEVILFENVPGLAGNRFKSILEQLRRNLAAIGYKTGPPSRINAADYRVPQRRTRCLLFAVRGQKTISPPAALTPPGERITVSEAFKGLRPLQAGEQDCHDALHFARNHSPIALKRLAHIPKNGGSRFSLPPNLELQCHKGKKSYPDVYGRMCREDVAPTLTTGCTDITKGRFGHPEDDRAITLREAARLQTFPDSYKFVGNSGQIATQIGNAVPMKLIEALAPVIRTALQ